MQVTQKEINSAYNKYVTRLGGVKEDYFGLLYMAKEYQKSVEDIYTNVTFGGFDFGIDGYYIDSHKRNLYLYQFKWTKSHSLFENSFKRLITEGIDQVFGNPKQQPRKNSLIAQLKSDLLENQSLIDKVFIRFIFNGEVETAENSRYLDSLREDLEGKKYVIDEYFQNKSVNLIFQYLSNTSRRKTAPTHSKTTHRYELEFSDKISTEISSGETLTIGFFRLAEIYHIYKHMQSRLFERNIRFGLSPELAPNRSLRRSLKSILEGKDSPESFVFNHNGLTLSAESVDFPPEKIGQMVITEPRILNGAQTITSVNKFFEDNANHPNLKHADNPIEKVKVLAKVITNSSKEFIVNVTICNNKQNPVRPWNLRATDDFQLKFQDKFVVDLGVYYETAEKAFENLTDEQLEEIGVDLEHSKAIEMRKMALALLALQGEVGEMSDLGKIFEDERLYRRTFKDGYLQSDPRKILLCYKIQMRSRVIVLEILSKGSQKYEFLRSAKNLIWALLIQGVLNDPDLEELAENYGMSLIDHLNYTDYLKKMASRRVRPIIAELMRMKEYQAFIGQEKYAFTRRKTTYDVCMQIAKKKFRWQKMDV